MTKQRVLAYVAAVFDRDGCRVRTRCSYTSRTQREYSSGGSPQQVDKNPRRAALYSLRCQHPCQLNRNQIQRPEPVKAPDSGTDPNTDRGDKPCPSGREKCIGPSQQRRLRRTADRGKRHAPKCMKVEENILRRGKPEILLKIPILDSLVSLVWLAAAGCLTTSS